MSRVFGPIMQNGYVVRDLDKAMKHWTDTMGVGPFFVTAKIPFAECLYRGAPCDIDLAVAISFSGDLQIELVEQKNNVPSIYRDHLQRFGEGLHHAGVLSDDYAADVARLTSQGFSAVQHGSVTSGMRFAYFDSDRGFPGAMVELIEGSPGMRRFLDRVKTQAREWDGREPVRML
ncbi:VOC family protein [Terrarubrum flagellatum]|uniref:VOC family protein n=1 Tax=Terrirubrum flagellatum TaxID=2895980 RepID=UPI0031455F91